MNRILETCAFVVQHSQHVHIVDEHLDAFVASFTQQHMTHWIDDAPFDVKQLDDKELLHFLVVFNAVSFSYRGTPKWHTVYHDEPVDGAYGMICCIAKARERGISLLDPHVLATLTAEQLQQVLAGNVEIPLFAERLAILQEVGRVLVEQFDADMTNMVMRADGDCQKLLQLIIRHFPCFEDSSLYCDRRIYFYKRAQILTADIAQTFASRARGVSKHIETLTACADYKLPLVLRKFGVFVYSDELASMIDTRQLIPKDSVYEVELRANTIWAIDMMTKKIKTTIPHADSIHVNDHVWLLSQHKSPDDKPYHLTRTTSY